MKKYILKFKVAGILIIFCSLTFFEINFLHFSGHGGVNQLGGVFLTGCPLPDLSYKNC